MAISIKTIERGEPGVPGGGEKKFCAANVVNGEVNIDKLSENSFSSEFSLHFTSY
ncbi:MAG: hypothetical protein WEA56_01485 [Balneolaceae bacterium]